MINNRNSIVVYDLQENEQQVFSDSSPENDHIETLAWSPDSDLIGFIKGSALYVISLDTKTPELISEEVLTVYGSLQVLETP